MLSKISTIEDISFSVIIPTYNRAAFIVNTIQSVLSQTYTNFEIIVVDDGSTDNTEEKVKLISNPKIHYYKKENAERGAARNYGILKANGKYICFLDSDDIFYPEHLTTAHDTILNHNTPEAFHLGYETKRPDGTIINKTDNLPPTANQLLIKGNCLSCNGIFLRADIAIRNLFNENRTLAGLEDWELWLRIASQFPIYINNNITSVVINHDARSVSTTPKEKQIARVNFIIDCIISNPVTAAYYKKNLHQFKSSCYTYIALHLALTKNERVETINYLIKGINESPKAIFTRRFFAIVKHYII